MCTHTHTTYLRIVITCGADLPYNSVTGEAMPFDEDFTAELRARTTFMTPPPHLMADLRYAHCSRFALQLLSNYSRMALY